MGRNKLLIDVSKRPLLSRTIASCRAVLPEVMLVAKEKEPFTQFDCRVVIDKPGVEGPLAGVITALEDCHDDTLFLTAADLFDLSPVAIQTLIELYSGEQYLGIKEPDHTQPLCGIYAKTSLAPLLNAAREGRIRMSEAIRELDCRFIPPPPGQWRNINSPEDIRMLGGTSD